MPTTVIPSPAKKPSPMLTVRQITERLGGKHPSTILRTIARLGMKADKWTNSGQPLYHERKIPRIQRSTAICVPDGMLTAGELSRRPELNCDQTTVWRILNRVLKLKPDHKLPGKSRGGASYWHEDKIPLIVAARSHHRAA